MVVRVHVEGDLGEGSEIVLDANQVGYLARVMRLEPGDEVAAFNGRHGEWRARLVESGKRGARLLCVAQTRPQGPAPDLTLLFAPLKRQATDWLVEKATELGVGCLQPVITRRTIAETVRLDRLGSIAREAAEQCERLSVPVVRSPIALGRLLEQWDLDRPILFADESGEAAGAFGVASSLRGSALLGALTGPEGGFDPSERMLLRACPAIRSVTLGPRILRAETAALVLLTLAQAGWGDLCALPPRERSRT